MKMRIECACGRSATVHSDIRNGIYRDIVDADWVSNEKEGPPLRCPCKGSPIDLTVKLLEDK